MGKVLQINVRSSKIYDMYMYDTKLHAYKTYIYNIS